MKNTAYVCHAASPDELKRRWAINIADNPDDHRWILWAGGAMRDNDLGKSKTFIALYGDEPIGEVTLLLSPQCAAVGGRLALANGADIANVNALRVDAPHQGKGLATALVRCLEQYAQVAGCQTLTIGVEAAEARNLAIYLHWGYTTFVTSAVEEGALVLYYAKAL